jgi:hypothetical protein
MAQPLASLAIELTANIVGFTSDLGRAQRESEQFAKRLEQRFNAVGTALGAALVTGIAGVSAAVAKTVNEFDRVANAAEKLNLTTESLTALGFAAAQSGSSVEVLEGGLSRLNRVIGDAASGNAAAADLFKRLGIEVRDAGGKIISTDDAFAQIADRFQGYADDAAEVAIATQLFGRAAGPELRQLLNQGSEGIAELSAQAAQLGVVISTDAAEAAKSLKDNVDQLTGAAQGFANGLTSSLLPALAGLAERTAEATRESGGFAGVGERLGNTLTTVAGVFIAGGAQVQKFAVIVGATVDVLRILTANIGQVASVARLQFSAIAQAATGNILGAAETMKRAQVAARSLAGELANNLNAKLDAARGSFAAIDQAAEESIGALQGRFESVGSAADETSGSVGDVAVATTDAGQSAEKASRSVDKLSSSVARLRDPVEDARELLLRLAGELAGPIERAAMRYRDQLVEIAQAQAALFAQGPPTAEMLAYFTALEEAAQRAGEEYAVIRDEFAAGSEGIAGNGRQTADDLTRSFEGFTDAASAAFGDFITGGIEDFEEFGDALKSIAERFLSDLVRQFLTTQLRLPSPSFGGGPSGSIGSLFGGPSAALSNRLGLGIAGLGIAAGGISGGRPLQGAIGGGLTGFQVGGPIGAAIGAILGGLASAFNRTRTPNINIGPNIENPTRFQTALANVGLNTRSIDGNAVQQSIINFDRAIADMLRSVGVSAQQFDAIRNSLESVTANFRGDAATPEAVIKARFDAILATFDEATQAFVRQGATLEEQVARLGERAEFGRLLDELLESLDPEPIRDQVQEINDYFDSLRERATELAATQEQLDQIEAARARTLAELAEAQERSRIAELDGLLGALRFEDSIAGLSESAREIARINAQFDETRRRALELGATQEDLEVIERRRAAAIRDVTRLVEEQTAAILAQAEAARTQIEATLGDLEFEDLLTTLEPLDAELARVNRRFDELREQIIAQAAEYGDLIDITDQLARLEDLRTRALRRAADAANDYTDAIEDQAAAFNGTAQQIAFNFEQLFAAIGQLPDPERAAELRALLQQIMSGGLSGFQAGNALSQILAAVGQFLDGSALGVAAGRLRDLQSAAQGVADFLNRQAFGTSSLSPQQRFAEAQRQFNDLARRAAGGDVEAIRAISGGAQTFLDQAAAFFGTGSTEFRGIEAYVRDILDPIAGITTAQTLPEAMSELSIILARLVEVLTGQASGPNSIPEAVSAALRQVLEGTVIASDRALRDAIVESSRLARST